jgi:hypothetical protein
VATKNQPAKPALHHGLIAGKAPNWYHCRLFKQAPFSRFSGHSSPAFIIDFLYTESFYVS